VYPFVETANAVAHMLEHQQREGRDHGAEWLTPIDTRRVRPNTDPAASKTERTEAVRAFEVSYAKSQPHHEFELMRATLGIEPE
jgi:hypothetical protein